VGSAPGRVFYDIPRIRQDAQLMMSDPLAAIEQLGLDTLDTTCEESYD
jgi:hypothetical protein